VAPARPSRAMPFRDLYPFKRGEGRRHGNYAIAPSTDGSAAPTFTGPARRDAQPGTRAQYRLALTSMEVPGLPESLRVGRVVIEQADGPLWTQRTHVQQKPGWRPIYVKHMDQDVLELAAGYRLTICTIDVAVPADLVRAMREWRDEALAAMAFVVAVLDERIAQEVLAEDLLLFDDAGNPNGAADHVTQVRAFVSSQRVVEQHRRVLHDLSDHDPAASSPVVAAARWYLRAVQNGVTPDAVVFFWIALEALTKPPYGSKLSKAEKKTSDVAWVEQGLRNAGLNPDALQPPVGRLAGLRAEIVHGGVESPTLLREGYYTLELCVRLLLRQQLGIGPVGWPLAPGASNLRAPFARAAEAAQRFPRTEWH
jgi:hypothetical protein